jgi:hypothetical protein
MGEAARERTVALHSLGDQAARMREVYAEVTA